MFFIDFNSNYKMLPLLKDKGDGRLNCNSRRDSKKL